VLRQRLNLADVININRFNLCLMYNSESDMRLNVLEKYLDHNNKNKQPLIGLATLMSLAYAGKDLSPIGAQLLELAEDDNAEALMDLSVLVQLKGDHDTGVALQQQALMLKQHYQLPPQNLKSPIKLLAIMAPGDLMTNTPLEFITEGIGIELDMLYVSPEQPIPNTLPEHDIAMIAVSELDRNYHILKMLETQMDNWPTPIINKARNIVKMARYRSSIMLQNHAGINSPVTSRINHTELKGIISGTHNLGDYLNGSSFPFIIRPIDSHAGYGLTKIENTEEISAYLLNQYNEDYFISSFVNYKNTDQQYRKYRIVLIQGKPFIVHMAISDHWMVHYANAGMAENAVKRAEEELIMKTFDDDFSKRHALAFEKIYKTFGLDYIGIDCSEMPDGDLLIFELGNSLTVHSLDSVEIFPYKKTQIDKIFNGFGRHLEKTLIPNIQNNAFTLIKS